MSSGHLIAAWQLAFPSFDGLHDRHDRIDDTEDEQEDPADDEPDQELLPHEALPVVLPIAPEARHRINE